MSEPPTPEQVTEWANHVGMAPYDVERRYTRLLREFAALASAWGYEQGARSHALEVAAIVEQWYDGSRSATAALQRIDDLCSVPIRALDPAPEEPRLFKGEPDRRAEGWTLPEGTVASGYTPITVLRQDGTRVPLDELLAEYDALKLATAQTEHKGE